MIRMLLTLVLFASTAAVAEKEFFDPFDGAAPFSAAVRVGDTLYLSGVLGAKDRKIVEGGITAETARALEIIGERLADIDDFAKMNEVYTGFFAPPRPVRTTVAVSGLALGANVEIECIAAF